MIGTLKLLYQRSTALFRPPFEPSHVMIWTVDSDVVVSLLVIKFFIADNNGLLVWYSISLKLLCLVKETYLLALVNLATTGSFVSVSMSKLWLFGSESRWFNFLPCSIWQ